MFQRLRRRVTNVLQHRKEKDDAATNLAGVQDDEAMRIVKDEEEDEQEASTMISPYPPSHAFQPKRVVSIIAVLGSHSNNKMSNELEKFSRYRPKDNDGSATKSTTTTVSSSGAAGVRPFAGRKLSIMDPHRNPHQQSSSQRDLSSITERVPSSRRVGVERPYSKPAEETKATKTLSSTTMSPNHKKRRSNPFAWKYQTTKTSTSPRRSSTSTTIDSVPNLEEASSDNSLQSTTTLSDHPVEDDDNTPPPTLQLEPVRHSFRTTKVEEEEEEEEQEEPTIATTNTVPPTAPANDDPLGDLEMELNPVRELRWRLRSKYMGHIIHDDDEATEEQTQHEQADTDRVPNLQEEASSSDSLLPSTASSSDPVDDDDDAPPATTTLLEPVRHSFRTTTQEEETQEETTIATTTAMTSPAAPANDDPLGDLEMELNPVRQLRWRLRSKYMGLLDEGDTEQQKQQQPHAQEKGLKKEDSTTHTTTKDEEQSLTFCVVYWSKIGHLLSEGGHVLYDTKNSQYQRPAPGRLPEDCSTKDDKLCAAVNTHVDNDDPMRRRRKPTLMRASKRSSALDFVEPVDDEEDDDDVKKPSRRTLSYVTGLVFANDNEDDDDDEDSSSSDGELMLSFATLERMQNSWTTAKNASSTTTSPLQSPRSLEKENSQNGAKGPSSSFRGFSSSRRLSPSSKRRQSSRRLLVDGSTSATFRDS